MVETDDDDEENDKETEIVLWIKCVIIRIVSL